MNSGNHYKRNLMNCPLLRMQHVDCEAWRTFGNLQNILNVADVACRDCPYSIGLGRRSPQHAGRKDKAVTKP